MLESNKPLSKYSNDRFQNIVNQLIMQGMTEGQAQRKANPLVRAAKFRLRNSLASEPPSSSPL